MKEVIQREVVKLTCDYCHEEMQFDTIIVSHGYGSDYDTETWHLCSIKHLIKYIKYKRSRV